MATHPHWTLSTFEQLLPQQLYALLQLRAQVFVVEQACLFQDMDGLDPRALHLLGSGDAGLIAYARCFPPGVSFAEASVGRIVTHPAARGTGLGHLLLARAMEVIRSQWGEQPVRIGAQARLKAFYQGHGFADVGRPYDEDGIAHLEMLWSPPTPERTPPC